MSQSLIAVIAEEDASLSSHISVIRSAKNYEELSNAQQKTYQMKITIYQMKKKLVEKMIHDMKLIDNVVKTSTRSYISSTQINLSIKNILKKLAAKYQRSNDQIVEQIFDQYRSLQQPSFKQKIEKWIVEWKTLYQEIVDMNLFDQYENEKIFVNEFFKTKKKWISQFCESWVRILKNSFRSIKFYETIKKYHIESKTYFDEMKNSSFRKMNMINIATLQSQN